MRYSTIPIIFAAILGFSVGSSMASETTSANHPWKNSKAFATRPVGHFRRMRVATDVDQTARESLEPIACSTAKITRKAVSLRCLDVRAQQAL